MRTSKKKALVHEALAGYEERQKARSAVRLDKRLHGRILRARSKGAFDTLDAAAEYLRGQGIRPEFDRVFGMTILKVNGVELAYRPDRMLDRAVRRKPSRQPESAQMPMFP